MVVTTYANSSSAPSYISSPTAESPPPPTRRLQDKLQSKREAMTTLPSLKINQCESREFDHQQSWEWESQNQSQIDCLRLSWCQSRDCIL